MSVFISYSHADEQLCNEFRKYLTILQRQGIVTSWYDRMIAAGTEWEGMIDSHLDSARVIILLVSVDFIASRYCYDVEMKRALARHDQRQALVISKFCAQSLWRVRRSRSCRLCQKTQGQLSPGLTAICVCRYYGGLAQRNPGPRRHRTTITNPEHFVPENSERTAFRLFLWALILNANEDFLAPRRPAAPSRSRSPWRNPSGRDSSP